MTTTTYNHYQLVVLLKTIVGNNNYCCCIINNWISSITTLTVLRLITIPQKLKVSELIMMIIGWLRGTTIHQYYGY